MIQIDGNSLTLEDIYLVAVGSKPAALAHGVVNKINQSRSWVENIITKGEPVYGINTGFGVFADQQIANEEIRKLNRNLILSHAVGIGASLPTEVVRAAMLIRVNTLAKGYSGVRLQILETFLEMLNRGVHPVIPSQGSLGSSGDLAPLSHLALVLTTDEKDLEEESGTAEYQGVILPGKNAMAKAGISRIILEAKEGIALNNGATFSAALAALICRQSKLLLEAAEIALAFSLESMRGLSHAFDPRIHESRPHPGQIRVAQHVRGLIQGSTLVDSTDRVQDAYSLRCGPQVQGPAWEILQYANQVVEREINSATDNPLLFGDGEAISGGNFHGEPIGLVMDYLGIALTEIAGISERRTYRLTDGKLNGTLPPMLVDRPEEAGLNSGMMMPQYTASSLVLENRTLASPDSIHSLPTSAAQEDHNANSMTAARHTWQILENSWRVLAIELYTAARALDIQNRENPHLKPGRGTRAAYQAIRDQVPYQPGDALWGPEIDLVHQLITSGGLSAAVKPFLFEEN
jgi:histidine ammonia-lyase